MTNLKAIILLFLANAVSGVAQGISMIAIPWYFAKQDQLTEFGLIYIFTNVLSFFWVPISGTLIDRFDRKHVFLAITVVGGSLIGFVSFLGFKMDGLPIYLVASVFIFTFLNYNIHFPNVLAFVQEITKKEKYSLMTSIMEIMGQVTTISAGALGTLLLEGTQGGMLNIFGMGINIGFEIEPWQIHEIFLIDALTYFASFIIISFITYVSISPRKSESGSVKERFKVGWQYLKNDKPILIYGILSYVVFVAMLMEAFYLGVSYVNNHLQGTGDVYANSKIAYSIGAIITGIFLKYLFERFSLPLITVVLTFATAMIFFTQFATNSLTIFFIMLFFLGITNAGTRIVRITYLFRNVPNQYFGRSSSIFFLSNVVLRILLLILFTIPFFQESNNIIYAYLITSFMLIISGFLLIKFYKLFDNKKIS